MPKFKDLGINAIPMTMQPPEIGEGAGGGYRPPYDSDTQCPDQQTCGDTCVCSDDDYVDVATQCPDQQTCGDTCIRPRTTPAKEMSAFAPEAIAQLKQQMEEQLGL